MPELRDALKAIITDEIATRPSAIRGTITSVDTKQGVCSVEYTNPAGPGSYTAPEVILPNSRGLWHSGPNVGDPVTINMLQGDMTLPSIVESRWPNDMPNVEAQSAPRTMTYQENSARDRAAALVLLGYRQKKPEDTSFTTAWQTTGPSTQPGTIFTKPVDWANVWPGTAPQEDMHKKLADWGIIK